MCSIDGFTKGAPFDLKSYAAINANRGPDGTNYFEDEHIHMAHSLLAISPNNTGKTQPLVGGSKVFSYVGEVYGIDGWDTQYMCDLAISKDYYRLARHTNGMWAWTLYDANAQTLTLCRDHFGVKQLYYMEHNGVFYWSSTMKPLIAVLNETNQFRLNKHRAGHFLGMESFLRFTNIPYNKISSFPPATVRTISLKDFSVLEEYSLFEDWDLSDNYFYDEDEFREHTRRTLTEAITAPNVPKALGLSGGFDSTLIANFMKDDKSAFACTIGFENAKKKDSTTMVRQYHESVVAENTAELYGFPCHTSIYPYIQSVEYEDSVLRAMGSSSFDMARLGPRFMNIERAAKEGAKIFFGGDLADEVLTGYGGDQMLYLDRITSYAGEDPLGKGVQQRYMSKIIPRSFTWSSDAKSNYLFRRILWASEGYASVADHLAGSFGMESRIPFLHQEFLRYATRIPLSIKLKCPREYGIGSGGNHDMLGRWKHLIRDVFRTELPEQVVTRGTKTGFSTPWNTRNKEINDKKQQLELDRSLLVLDYKIEK